MTHAVHDEVYDSFNCIVSRDVMRSEPRCTCRKIQGTSWISLGWKLSFFFLHITINNISSYVKSVILTFVASAKPYVQSSEYGYGIVLTLNDLYATNDVTLSYIFDTR